MTYRGHILVERQKGWNISCEGPFPYLVTSCVDPRTHQRHQINLQTSTGNIQPFLSFRIEQGSLPFILLAKRRSVSYGLGIGCVLARIVFFKAVALPVTWISRCKCKCKCKCKCHDWEDKHTCPLYIAFCSGLGHQHTKGADGSRYQSIYEPTEPSQPMMSDDVSDEDRPQHRELRPLLFSNSVWVL